MQMSSFVSFERRRRGWTLIGHTKNCRSQVMLKSDQNYEDQRFSINHTTHLVGASVHQSVHPSVGYAYFFLFIELFYLSFFSHFNLLWGKDDKMHDDAPTCQTVPLHLPIKQGRIQGKLNCVRMGRRIDPRG